MTADATLVVDVGGTRIKAATVVGGAVVGDPVVSATPYPLAPAALVDLVVGLGDDLAGDDRRAGRTTVGFPGFVRHGTVLTAPHFTRVAGPGSEPDADLIGAWEGHRMADALARALGGPVLLANDAVLHGAAVVEGCGVEVVVTLGTGVGLAVFDDGRPGPHVEIAHHPLADGATYNEHVGERARRAVGDRAWSDRVGAALDALDVLLRPDRIWLGGGNAERVDLSGRGGVTRIEPLAALVGGARLWTLPRPS